MCFICVVHLNNNLRVDMLLHSDKSSWFRANQFLLLLSNDLYLVQKQQIISSYPLVWTWAEHGNHDYTDVVRELGTSKDMITQFN